MFKGKGKTMFNFNFVVSASIISLIFAWFLCGLKLWGMAAGILWNLTYVLLWAYVFSFEPLESGICTGGCGKAWGCMYVHSTWATGAGQGQAKYDPSVSSVSEALVRTRLAVAGLAWSCFFKNNIHVLFCFPWTIQIYLLRISKLD